MHLVEWSDDRIAGYLAEGATIAAPLLADGRELRDVPLDECWRHPRATQLRPWTGADLLMIFPRGRRARVEGRGRVRGGDRSRVIAERPWPTGLESWQPPPGFVPPALPDG